MNTFSIAQVAIYIVLKGPDTYSMYMQTCLGKLDHPLPQMTNEQAVETETD